MFSLIKRQNQWYDSLSDSWGSLRFLVFLTPQLMGFTIDLYWVVLFSGTPFFTYLAWLLMALWRIPYMIMQRHNR